jgi:hypothetical protein
VSVGLYSGVSGLALGTGLYKNVSGLWGGASGLIDGFGGGSPFSGASLYLNFLAGAPLDPRVTFSRGSNATLVDSTGKITYAPANLLLNSVFDGAVSGTPGTAPTSWPFLSSGGTLTVTSLGRSYTANALRFAATSNRQYINQFVTAAANSTYILSARVNVFTTAQVQQLLGLSGVPAGATVQYVYNGANQASTFSPPTGTGLLQLIITTAGTGGTPGVRVGVGTSSNTTADVSFEDIQLEQVTYQTTPGTYNATTSAAYYGPRFDYDPVTLAAKGLLIEEQRTNLLTYSQEFGSWTNSGATVTANTLLSPDGTTSADTIARATGTADAVYNTATFTGDGVKAVSLWIKKGTSPSTLIALLDATASVYRLWADVTWSGTTPSLAFTNGSLLSSTNYGNGWWRLEFATTSVTAANTNRVYVYPGRTGSVNGDTVYCWGAQAENATFATSYIPTVASTVTRSADVATMTGTNFSSWYNQSEGTFIADTSSTAASARSLTASAGAVANQLYLQSAVATSIAFNVFTASAFVAQLGSLPASALKKVAGAYKVNDFAASVDGGTVDTDTSGALATYSQLNLGANALGTGAFLNGHIRQIAYYNTRLPNSQLQTLTAPSLATTLSLSFTNQAYTVGV